MDTLTRPFENWMRNTLFVSSAVNLLGAITFVPAFRLLRDRSQFPDAHPLYLWIISIWILAFGAGYLYMALTRRPDKIFIAVGAAGKLSFFVLLLCYSLGGLFPLSTAFSAIVDLILAVIFIGWLWKNRELN
jgi:hypothetical protein